MPFEESFPKSLFIGGHARSGTTLLLSLLDSHPDLLVYPRETHFLRLVSPIFRRDPQDAVDYMLWYASRRGSYGPIMTEEKDIIFFQERIRYYFERHNRTFAALLHALMLGFGDLTRRHEWKLWVEKTPGVEHQWKNILQHFPDAKLLYMVRDPRAVYTSFQLRTKDSRVYWPLVRFCARWKASLRALHQARALMPVLVVHYERLLTEPRSSIEEICSFLDIPFTDSMLQPTLVGKQFKGISGYSPGQTNFTHIDRSPLDKWQTVLPTYQQKVIWYMLRPYMRTFGYEADYVTAPRDSVVFLLQYRLPAYAYENLFIPLPETARRSLALLVQREQVKRKNFVELYRRHNQKVK